MCLLLENEKRKICIVKRHLLFTDETLKRNYWNWQRKFHLKAAKNYSTKNKLLRDDLKRQIFFKKRQTKKLSIKIIERQPAEAAAAEVLSTTWEIKHRKSRIGIKTYVPKLWSSSSSSSLKIFITHKMIFWFANIHTLESKKRKKKKQLRVHKHTYTHIHTHILEYHFLRTRRMRT